MYPTMKHSSKEYISVGSAKCKGNLQSLPLSIFVISFALQTTSAIITKYTHQAMNGYYCVTPYISNYTAIEHQRCVDHCTTDPNCWILAYNSKGKYCLLATQLCVKAMVGDDFRMMTFRKHENILCIQWVWSDGIPYPPRILEQVRPVYQALARKPVEGEIYIGRSQPGARQMHIARNGVVVSYTEYYLLVVSESCSVAWVPYTAGNQLPRGAVEGGYLNSLGTTYCMRVWDAARDPAYTYGYYAPSNGLGYYIWYGAKTTTQMDILVQVHLFYWFTEAHIHLWLVSNGTGHSPFSFVGIWTANCLVGSLSRKCTIIHFSHW